MGFEPTDAPESSVDSGDESPSVAGGVSRPAPAAGPTPEVGANGAFDAPDSPVPAPGEGSEQELDAVVGDGPEPEIEFDVAALSAKAAKADEYLSLAQRTQADFENYRKRATREAAAAQERGAIKLALELLPAVDNLERALAHAAGSADSADDTATFLSGLRHVHADLLGALKRAGIEAYSPEGEPFDPQYHEAVAQTSVDGAQSGTVVEVFQRGYRRGENVLRPARVVVAG